MAKRELYMKYDSRKADFETSYQTKHGAPRMTTYLVWIKSAHPTKPRARQLPELTKEPIEIRTGQGRADAIKIALEIANMRYRMAMPYIIVAQKTKITKRAGYNGRRR